ncbi:MAG: hypothetical protein HFJ02_05070 [Bacilli bacterium]|nr:hypothetical protein [Bacilli bacterium]
MGVVSEKALLFKEKYKRTIAWRLKQNSSVIEKHLNPEEEVLYVFVGQKNENPLDFFSTAVIALTNKRLMIGQKRVLFGYSLNFVTPDLFNDMQVYKGLRWGKITIDTAKEVIIITNLAKKSLPEIETMVTEFMMKEKQKYEQKEKN